MIKTKLNREVWSAAPTPFTEDMQIDFPAIRRLAEHHIGLGVQGLFLGGTAGEGSWLPASMRFELVRETVKAIDGRMPVMVQITDNSALQMLENIKTFQDTGIDAVVISNPGLQFNADHDYTRKIFDAVISQSPMPVGIYYKGCKAPHDITAQDVLELSACENVCSIKDSSASLDDMKILLETKTYDHDIALFNGDEFDCVPYLRAGYDGLLIGGASFNAKLAGAIIKAVAAGDYEAAALYQGRMVQMMYDVYGGTDVACWLAGQKRLMVELGIFSTDKTIINYSVTPECEQAIVAVMQRDKEWLFPEPEIVSH
jgi:dihydrodipicolinate synthase/N-acetylneuraminate lyase